MEKKNLNGMTMRYTMSGTDMEEWAQAYYESQDQLVDVLMEEHANNGFPDVAKLLDKVK